MDHWSPHPTHFYLATAHVPLYTVVTFTSVTDKTEIRLWPFTRQFYFVTVNVPMKIGGGRLLIYMYEVALWKLWCLNLRCLVSTKWLQTSSNAYWCSPVRERTLTIRRKKMGEGRLQEKKEGGWEEWWSQRRKDGGTITHDKNRLPKTSLCSSREC